MKNNGWKSYLCLEIMEKMNRFALLNFKKFWGQCPQTPYWGGATAPLPRPHPLGEITDADKGMTSLHLGSDPADRRIRINPDIES